MSHLKRDREIYLSESRYENPKEIFKQIVTLAENTGGVVPGMHVCDAGCAAGEFLYHLQQRHPGVDSRGFDPIEELVQKARAMVPFAHFIQGSVMTPDVVDASSCDLVFMNGVHSSLPDMDTCLDNLLDWTKPGGRVFIFGIFNPYPLEAAIRYRSAEPAQDGQDGQPEWTDFFIHSRHKVEQKLGSHRDVIRHSFIPFEPPLDLEHRPSFPMRAWTFKNEHGARLLTNGLSVLINCFILVIWKKP